MQGLGHHPARCNGFHAVAVRCPAINHGAIIGCPSGTGKTGRPGGTKRT
ncbi:hypothetical protein H206_05588 [Candidatus Electrothrix aarhusensis]|uniref:Uncharacterized protein n=1 Tax=Candidatus Electrothrix aarhusensis TaxID=1859131 RepID=A0A3S3R1D1_9BACT|nr:hypothetical protein H206_05588 [Candidatus Electrothrix aarhusensis]